jgi:hypothetical protein
MEPKAPNEDRDFILHSIVIVRHFFVGGAN